MKSNEQTNRKLNGGMKPSKEFQERMRQTRVERMNRIHQERLNSRKKDQK
jgi:hypothetical protein